MRQQTNLFSFIGDSTIPSLDSYDYIIVFFSGGKDSIAMVLLLLELGVPKEKIELWHHEVDGREGSELMDWPCTSDYCRKFAEAFGLKIHYSWREGGFEREMLRDNSNTASVIFELPDGTFQKTGGTRNSPGTRLKYPQVSADLNVRWCSAYLKIMVAIAAISNQLRFKGKRTLVLSGERGEESPARERYKDFEAHKTNCKSRHVDQWRPVLRWTEQMVWAIIEKHGVLVHPCYFLGFSRCSCALCIFILANAMATLAKINPGQVSLNSDYEKQFGLTIKRKESIEELVSRGRPYNTDDYYVQLALNKEYTGPIFTDNWLLPAGAYGESGGPC